MKKKLKCFSIMFIAVTLLSGCSSLKDKMITAMDNQQIIELSVNENSYNTERNKLDWVELDQLERNKGLRKTWDDKLNIIRFDVNSKNGSIFVDLDGNWAGNNTLYNAFQNKVFVQDYWNDSSIRSDLAQAAMGEFSDITNENTGIVASVNSYFNIVPTNADDTSGMFNYLTRAEVMSALYRADTPVILQDINENFESAVGKNDYNIYAQNLASYSYLDYSNNSLNQNTYNSTMTRAEAIYMIVQRYYKNEYDATTGKESGLTDCKNAGDVATKIGLKDKFAWQEYELEYCLQNSNKGVTNSIYRALIVAKNKGIITSDTRWNSGITGGELVNMLINAYNNLHDSNNFIVNAKIGANAGSSLYVAAKPEEPIKQEQQLGTVKVQKIRDISDIDDLIDEYGDELDMTEEEIEEARQTAEGFTIEPCDKYMNVDFCSYLNVRVGPGTEFSIKKSVSTGTKVHIVGIVAENGWYRVIADGKISYQCGVYFSDLEGQDTSNLVQEYETAKDLDIINTEEDEDTVENTEEVISDTDVTSE